MWSIGIVAVFVVYYFYASEDSTTVLESFAIGMDVLLDWLFNRSFFPSVLLQSGEIANMFFVFFWAGFAPSVWLWLYVSALFVTRSILRSERVVNWLRWFLDVEKNPFRSIGAVAAALAFIASDCNYSHICRSLPDRRSDIARCALFPVVFRFSELNSSGLSRIFCERTFPFHVTGL